MLGPWGNTTRNKLSDCKIKILCTNKILMPLPTKAPDKNFNLVGKAVSEKIFETVDDGRTAGGRTDAGSWPSYKISYLLEPTPMSPISVLLLVRY